jgi:hypothetical protein
MDEIFPGPIFPHGIFLCDKDYGAMTYQRLAKSWPFV